MRNYSRIAAPLTKLYSTKLNIAWSPAAQSAFTNLKTLFSSAPVPIHPDPRLQFTVVAILSQWSSFDQKLHPCAFFSVTS